MRTVVSSREVPRLWIHQSQEHARNSNGSLFFQGDTIYSYGEHFPIARIVQRKGRVAVLFTTATYSVTTSSHCSSVSRAIPPDLTVFNVPLDKPHTLDEWVEDYDARIDLATAKVALAKKHASWAAESLGKLVTEANAFIKFWGLKRRFKLPSDFDAVRAKLKRDAARKTLETKQRNAEILKRNKQEIADWQNGVPYSSIPYAVPEIYLRVRDGEIETSRGARFPVDHALKALRIIRSVKLSGEPYRRGSSHETIHVGHYSIDSIDKNGNVTVGCHRILNGEIERIGALLEAQ